MISHIIQLPLLPHYRHHRLATPNVNILSKRLSASSHVNCTFTVIRWTRDVLHWHIAIPTMACRRTITNIANFMWTMSLDMTPFNHSIISFGDLRTALPMLGCEAISHLRLLQHCWEWITRRNPIGTGHRPGSLEELLNPLRNYSSRPDY